MDTVGQEINHECAECAECLHDDRKCCGCYDGACCQAGLS